MVMGRNGYVRGRAVLIAVLHNSAVECRRLGRCGLTDYIGLGLGDTPTGPLVLRLGVHSSALQSRAVR